MASNQAITGSPAVLNEDPDPDEYGVVARVAGWIGGNAYVLTRYDIGTSTIYIGTAARGTAATAAGWTIRRITLVSGNPTISEWTNAGTAIWDNRAVETYS